MAIYLATLLVPGVKIEGGAISVEGVKVLLFAGIVLGLINSFAKPIIKVLTLPLRVLTLGLFGIVINMAIVWLVDVLFRGLVVPGIKELFFASLIVWLSQLLVPKKKKGANDNES